MSNHPTSKAAEFEGLLIARADAALLDWCDSNRALIATALRLHEIVSNPSGWDLQALLSASDSVWHGDSDAESLPFIEIRAELKALCERAEQRAKEEA